ncbi:ABC transporter permease [Enterococcus rivorum]|uniref:ABC-2 type transporter transmembrane domain-containing protein n=1 Tax=Enterococcus rivorum TaxID=762845 RepID=A0A1E5KT03_9ENTE|nr:ABC transporter permease [Enterococcus rivorum]MBP2098169.1 ABC-2 type transport system permease protein [Enterococcus rivorum]OEH80908.1 hypothetical protein BCR26_06665 [Enterococcus rivorum]
MLVIIKNDWYRTWNNKGRLVMMFLLMIAAMVIALYMGNHAKERINIGVVGEQNQALQASEIVQITYLTQLPPTSELVKGTYDAIIQKKDTGFEVKTIKNDDYRKKVAQLLAHPSQKETISGKKRGTGSLIIGFLLMFILMTSLTNSFTFNEDKEKRMIERVLTTPINLLKLLLAHSLFSFLLLFIPTLLIVYSAKLIFQLSIGFNLLEYFLLLGLICLFATAVSLFFAALFDDSDRSNMMGSVVVVISTILSGSFFSFANGNRWLNTLIQLLPQKRYLDIVTYLEQGELVSKMLPNILYVFVFTLLFFLFALLKTQKDYIRS